MKNGPGFVHAQSPRKSSVAQSLDGKGRLVGSLHFPDVKLVRQARSRKAVSADVRFGEHNGLKPDIASCPLSARTGKSLTSVAPSQAEHRSVAWLGGQASYWHIATRATAKTARHDHVRPSRNRHLPEISRLSSVLTQDRHVGRFAGFQGLPRVGGQGDGYQKLIAVIVAVCGYRL